MYTLEKILKVRVISRFEVFLLSAFIKTEISSWLAAIMGVESRLALKI